MDSVTAGFVKEAAFGPRLRKVLQRVAQGGYAKRTLQAARDARLARNTTRSTTSALGAAIKSLDPPPRHFGDRRLRKELFDNTLAKIRMARSDEAYDVAKRRLKDAPFVRGLGVGLGALALGGAIVAIKNDDLVRK